MDYLLLALSVVLATGRNMLAKDISKINFGTRQYFLCQGVLFLLGGGALLAFGDVSFFRVAPITIIYAVIYGIVVLLSQWFYVTSLNKGNVALCSTVQSLGFILPTLSGAIIWREELYFLDYVGILCAVAAIVVSGASKSTEKKNNGSGYFIPLLIAMLASGGLGIVQKFQQKSPYADQKSVFLLIAFALAAAISFIFFAFSKKQYEGEFKMNKLTIASFAGICFGCCNLINTILVGRMDSAIFFPTLNIGVILLSVVCAALLLKEKMTKKEISVLILGGASILLLNLA